MRFWPGAYITIDNGSIDPDLTVTVTETGRGKDFDKGYMPILPDRYDPGQPVPAFVEVDSQHLNQRFASVTGLVALTGLPGMVRAEFENKHLPAAERCIMVTADSKPMELRIEAAVDAVIGLLLIGVQVYRSMKSRRVAGK